MWKSCFTCTGALAYEDPFVWVQEIDFHCRPEIDLEEDGKAPTFLPRSCVYPGS